MKLSRILVLALAGASIATAASAQWSHQWGPQEMGWQTTYYSDFEKTQLVSVHYMGCNGVETWDGYNGNADITWGPYEDQITWDC